MPPRRKVHKDIAYDALTAEDPSSALSGWVSVVSCEARFPVEIFLNVLDEFILHPEHSSSNILRANLLDLPVEGVDTPVFAGLEVQKQLRRRLVPSRPFDGELDQLCSFYRGEGEALVTLIPEREDKEGDDMPFYHPDVSGIAFRYLRDTLRIDMRPRAHQHITRYEETSRTFRTALALLTSVLKRGEGKYLRNYVKRVHHDQLVPRDEVQDKRLELKPKYAWALQEWRESTPPDKHVFEDIAIAAYLIVLWKHMYASADGKPPLFVDLGCGNGLLTFILCQEGFVGYGIDLRSRKSWSLWREHSVQETRLEAMALDLPLLVERSQQEDTLSLRGAFLIGNHADELTPWIPLLATAYDCSGSLNLSCCAHDLSGRFTRDKYAVPDASWPTLDAKEAYDSVTSEKGGRYTAFVNRVAELTLECGWIPEREMLRTSSTRNAAIVGRRRYEKEDALGKVFELAKKAQTSGWAARPKDGKDH